MNTLHFCYSPPRINVGSIALNDSKERGCVSPMYVVFKCKNEKKLKPKYLYWLLQSEQLKEQIKFFAFGSVRQTLGFNDFCKMTIPVPSIEEQKRIVNELESYNGIIDNTQKAINEWRPYFNIERDWSIKKIGDICNNNAQYGISEEMNENNEGYPILRMGNLQSGMIDFFDIKYVILPEKKFQQFRLNKGDILFNRTNSFELVGKTAIFEGDMECCFASYLVKITIDSKKAIASFVNLFMNTDIFQKNIKNHAKQSNNQANINAQILLVQEIPLPPLEIQKQIVERFEVERKMIESQKGVIKLFESKINSKLASLWQNKEDAANEKIANM